LRDRRELSYRATYGNHAENEQGERCEGQPYRGYMSFAALSLELVDEAQGVLQSVSLTERV
jgi:hypothetical protein